MLSTLEKWVNIRYIWYLAWLFDNITIEGIFSISYFVLVLCGKQINLEIEWRQGQWLELRREWRPQWVHKTLPSWKVYRFTVLHLKKRSNRIPPGHDTVVSSKMSFYSVTCSFQFYFTSNSLHILLFKVADVGQLSFLFHFMLQKVKITRLYSS